MQGFIPKTLIILLSNALFMFTDLRGTWRMAYPRKKASQAFAKNALVDYANGTVQPCDASSTQPLGIGQKKVTSADDDYAVTNAYPVLVPVGQDATMEGDVTGSFPATLEGTKIDLSTALVADAAASTTDALHVVRRLSATKGEFQIAKPAQYDF